MTLTASSSALVRELIEIKISFKCYPTEKLRPSCYGKTYVNLSLIVLSWQHEYHRKPSDKPSYCALLRPRDLRTPETVSEIAPDSHKVTQIQAMGL